MCVSMRVRERETELVLAQHCTEVSKTETLRQTKRPQAEAKQPAGLVGMSTISTNRERHGRLSRKRQGVWTLQTMSDTWLLWGENNPVTYVHRDDRLLNYLGFHL